MDPPPAPRAGAAEPPGATAPPAWHYRRAWLAIGWLLVAALIWLSLTPSPLPDHDVGPFDAGHAMAYALLMLWFAMLYPGRRARVVVALALCALGVAIEFAQGMTGYRFFSVADMRDDAIGVAIGWLLVHTPLGTLLPAVDARLAARAGR